MGTKKVRGSGDRLSCRLVPYWPGSGLGCFRAQRLFKAEGDSLRQM